MSQTLEAEAFLARIAKLPPAPAATDVLSQALQPSLDGEAELRKLWATDKTNDRVQELHVGLVDVFDAPDDIRKTRARVVADDADLNAHHILPLPGDRRRKEGEPAMVATLDAFKQNSGIFTEGSLSQLTDWSNVVATGGAVQACLAPVPASALTSKRAMRRHFHNAAFPTSGVDIFLYGLTPAQAEAKMQVIYEAVRDSVPWDVTCVRTRHTVSIHSQYPYRSVQIVLRLYSSPAEILAGFDVDAPCCAWDGERVWASPRAVVAMMRQANTVDMTRRSPSYEVRLAKYSMRGFEVYVPALRREDIDPTIFERSIQRVQGLARLLVLERLVDAGTRQRYLIDRRKLVRTRPDAEIDYSRRKKSLKGDLKANIDIGGLEMNDYDVQSLHIPYGHGWDARRIDKLVYQTVRLGHELAVHPTIKDRRLHRHPAFFGTLKECIEDCCEYCPEPKDNEQKELQEKEDDSYVSIAQRTTATTPVTQYHRSAMLDEVIRRTGAGIEVPEESQDDDEPTSDGAKPKARSLKGYLGLNVHGKKRKDLAQKADPNAPAASEKNEFPLAWTAAHDGALECVRYLASERALAAYRYYASTHSDERAKYLRRIDGQIAQRLGWRSNELNESILTAAVIGDEVELLKAVIDLRPAQLQESLMARIHYVGFNHILVAANWGCSPEMFDYLLSKGVSPTDTDTRGRNVYHILAVYNTAAHLKLLDHILKKLPEDVSARMLSQQSKKALNTPLHIAVKKAGLKATKLLLKVKSAVFLLRSRDGSTPLQIAVRHSVAEITRPIGDAGPEEVFQMEDGVGNTPLEIATFNWLRASTGSGFRGTLPTFQVFNENMLHTCRNSDPQLVTVEEAKELKDTIDRLVASGRLRTGTKLTTDLTAFADKKAVEAKRTESDSPKDDSPGPNDPDAEYKKDIVVGADAIKTMEYIAGAVGSRRSAQQLIHLLDVHRSVQGSLDKSVYKQASGNNSHDYRNKDEDGLEPEQVEDQQEKARKRSAVSLWHSQYAFGLFGEDNL